MVYVQRVEWHVKPGRLQEATALLKDLRAQVSMPEWKRLYQSFVVGELNVIGYESEWESMEAWQKGNDKYLAMPEMVAFFKKFNELVDRGEHEAWRLIE